MASSIRPRPGQTRPAATEGRLTTPDYIVRIDSFEGPLDLLLYLIRREEVSIHDIPIARIADQYLEHLRGIERIDIELAGEFLVMAATLMEIKSRMLAPAPVEAPPEGEPAASEIADPRAELVEQLLAYRRYRGVADALETRKSDWERRFVAAAQARAAEANPAAPADEGAVDVDDLALFDLAKAFARIIETIDLERVGRASHEVRYDDTPLEVHAEDVLDQLRRAGDAPGSDPAGGVTLRALLSGRPRTEMIGLFLAVLELTRRRSVTIAPTDDRHDVRIALNTEPEAEAPSVTVTSRAAGPAATGAR